MFILRFKKGVLDYYLEVERGYGSQIFWFKQCVYEKPFGIVYIDTVRIEVQTIAFKVMEDCHQSNGYSRFKYSTWLSVLGLVH